ncbi:MAG: hypothetical protein OSJ65_02710 [Bacilli bacterium]|nr:hypothetical protein [Bacilli bacterium]
MKYDSFLYNSKTYTLAALIIGYILIEELTVDDQNAVGNWLMTIGQVLDGNAAIAQAIQNKIDASQNNNNNGNNVNNEAIINCIKEDKKTINELREMIKKIEKRLDELSR